ncbi:MAG TPA: DUF393 domain-containing protein [Nitrospira sp.]|nr:DUF393 domain-containing protein [Nitrospira sp.]
MTEPFSKQSGQCVLVYDGQCRLCVTAKNGLEQLRGESHADEVRLIPYQSEEAKQVLGAHYRPGRPPAAFLVHPDRTIATGLDAFLPLLPGLKGGHPLAKFLSLRLVKPFAYLAYRLVARYRYRLFGEVPLKRLD